jgi:hypothetical protein
MLQASKQLAALRTMLVTTVADVPCRVSLHDAVVKLWFAAAL